MFKILHVRWGEGVGGVETLLSDIAKFSDKTKYEVIFCFLKTGGVFGKVMQERGCKVTVITARNGYDIGVRMRLFNYIRKIKPDIVIEHAVPPLLRPIIKLAGSFPLITYDHGIYELYHLRKKHLSNWLIKYEYRFCNDHVMTNSNYNKHTIINRYKIKSKKVAVIYPGVDTGSFQVKSDHNASNLVLGYAGRIQFGDKGVDYLVPLAQELKRNKVGNFEIRVFGDGHDLIPLKKMVDDAALESSFRFYGTVSDIPAQLSQVDILVVPSKSEAFGLSPLEALAAGCGVVGFDVGGLKEAIGNCEQAVLVTPFDVSEMAKFIGNMWSSRKLNTSASIAAHDYVVKNYSISSFVTAFESFLWNVLKG